jgi:hypothetical protein
VLLGNSATIQTGISIPDADRYAFSTGVDSSTEVGDVGTSLFLELSSVTCNTNIADASLTRFPTGITVTGSIGNTQTNILSLLNSNEVTVDTTTLEFTKTGQVALSGNTAAIAIGTELSVSYQSISGVDTGSSIGSVTNSQIANPIATESVADINSVINETVVSISGNTNISLVSGFSPKSEIAPKSAVATSNINTINGASSKILSGVLSNYRLGEFIILYPPTRIVDVGNMTFTMVSPSNIEFTQVMVTKPMVFAEIVKMNVPIKVTN